MEPIKISIEVSLKEATLKAVEKIVALVCASRMVCSDPDATQSLCDDLRRDAEKIETKAEAAPAQTKKAEPVEAPTEPAQEDITDAQLREAVKDCKGRVPVAEIRNKIFAKYGIESSVECPSEKRAALLKDLQTYQPAAA